MTNDVRGLPARIISEQHIETPQRKLVLDVGFITSMRGATPSVKNINVFKCQNTAPVTITNFVDGQPAQQIWILGDGLATVQHGTRIITSSLADKLLEDEILYIFVYIDGIWHELSGSGSSATGGLVRQDTVVTTASLANGATENGVVALGKSFELFKLIADRHCRVRLYQTSAFRTADASRPVGTDPDTAHGVIGDFVFDGTSGLTIICQPRPAGENHDTPVVSDIYYAIENQSGGTSTVEVTFTHAITEN